jgi:hypothetical protein
MNLAIGTRVRWESAAGVLRGTIKNIVLAPAANGVITPWMDIDVEGNNLVGGNSTRLCASAPSLMMFQVALVA